MVAMEPKRWRQRISRDNKPNSTIREKIIPHDVSWFTGEAIEGEEFDIDNEDEDDDDIDENEDEDEEDDDEDGEEDDDEDEEEKKGGRPQLHDGQQGERPPPECKQQ